MALAQLDSHGIGRYEETTPIGPEFSDYLNLALESVSAAVGTWQSFTPTLNQFSLGNGSHDCVWARAGDLAFAKYLITFGTTTSITGSLSFVLPNGDSQGPSAIQATRLDGYYFDNSSSEYIDLAGTRSNNTTVNLRYPQPVTSGTPRITLATVNATAPVTPAAGDALFFVVTYRKS